MKLTKIGDFLKRSKIPIDILDNEEYKRVTIRINHNGVSLRDTEIGKKIGTKKQFILKSGQFIVSKIDARYGAFGIAPDEVNDAIITGNFWAYDVDFSKLNIDWFNQFTNSPDFYDLCERASSGITHRKYLNESFFLNYEIMLPSVEEQLIQIDKIKLQKISFGELTSELTHQLELIKQLRQAFLREAMQGKLVKSTNTKETGQQLLEKIKAEKVQLIAEKKLKNEKELPPITEDEIPFEIPEHWTLTTIENIAANEKNALKAGPFGSSLKKEYYVKKGFKIYGQEQVISNDPFLGDYYIDENRFKNLKSCEVKAGDILISLVGTMGKVLILPEGIEQGIINPRLVKISLHKHINREFFKYYLYSEIAVKQINHLSHGSTMNIINLGIIKKLIFPLPPFQEQEQIVAKLEELMAFCDGLEQSIAASQGYNEMLLQQVLREALQGEEVINE